MEANELRIGNYVTEEVLGKCEVYEIHYDTVWVLVNNITIEGKENTRSFHLSINHLNPIPLTEEWLLKFGFKEQIGFSKIIGLDLLKSFEVAHNDLDKWYCYFRNFNKGLLDDFVLLRSDLKHVHQIQNLYFALTNEELTIK
jgi:hypothetical protein